MENPLIALSNELAAAVEIAGQSVVAVHGRPRLPSSGVYWKPGVVVTADHTLRREEEIRVTLPHGKTVSAEIAGRDPGTDLAVLRLEHEDSATSPSGDCGDLRPGNLVLAVGRSHETGVSAAMGVISAVAGPWHTWRGGRVDRFIRLDLGLFPGSSGGAVFTAGGEFAGIATGGLSRSSAIAIPAETIHRVVDALLSTGHVTRGYLGVGLQPVALPEHLITQLQITAKSGLIVLSVEPESPAAQAGIVIGDVFVALDGKPTADTDDVQSALGSDSVGKTIPATVIRAGSVAELSITVRERPQRRA